MFLLLFFLSDKVLPVYLKPYVIGEASKSNGVVHWRGSPARLHLLYLPYVNMVVHPFGGVLYVAVNDDKVIGTVDKLTTPFYICRTRWYWMSCVFVALGMLHP